MSKLSSFLLAKPTTSGQYAFVVVRFVVAGFWLNSDLPRWTALAAGHLQANGLVRNLFGAGMAMPLTILFTLSETLGAIAYLLGLATRLVSIWPVVEFAITGITGVLTGSVGLTKDFGLFAGGLVLLLNGSPVLSLDAWLARKSSK